MRFIFASLPLSILVLVGVGSIIADINYEDYKAISDELCGWTPAFKGGWPKAWTSPYCLDKLSGETSKTGSAGKKMKHRTFSRGQKRMSHGYKVRPGEFPSFVRLKFIAANGTEMSCAGALISRGMVLTTGSCWPKEPVTFAKAYMGVHGVTRTEQIVERFIVRFCVPWEYDLNPYIPNYDVAMILLNEPVDFTDYIQPAGLPLREFSPEENVCIAVGEGNMRNSGEPAKNLIALPMDSGCNASGLPMDSRSCFSSAYDQFTGAPCEGDWGGPVYCMDRCKGFDNPERGFRRQTLVGLASFGPLHGCTPNIKQNTIYSDLLKLRLVLSKVLYGCFGSVGQTIEQTSPIDQVRVYELPVGNTATAL